MHALTYHGGRRDEAARRFPDAPLPWLDLSTGINPFAWTPPQPPQIDLGALPSVDGLSDLERAAGRAFRASTLPIAALPGSEIGLRLLATLGLPEPFRIVGPFYRTHADALPGATTIHAEQIDAQVERGGTILLANPNNPDGRLLAPARLFEAARRLAARGGVLIVDEAFAEAVPGASILPHLSAEAPVLVFRSFGKFFGLAGVRLGFVVGAGDLVRRIAAMLGGWPVSSTAIALGIAAYDDTTWIDAMRTRLAREAVALHGVLGRHGLAARGGCPLFTLVEHTDAGALFDRLARAGILTRPFDYAPTWLRVGLPDGPAALARLDAALGRG